jgi:hypothetical protein
MYVSGKVATTPTLFICDEEASPFDDLYLEWSCHGNSPIFGLACSIGYSKFSTRCYHPFCGVAA